MKLSKTLIASLIAVAATGAMANDSGLVLKASYNDGLGLGYALNDQITLVANWDGFNLSSTTETDENPAKEGEFLEKRTKTDASPLISASAGVVFNVNDNVFVEQRVGFLSEKESIKSAGTDVSPDKKFDGDTVKTMGVTSYSFVGLQHGFTENLDFFVKTGVKTTRTTTERYEDGADKLQKTDEATNLGFNHTSAMGLTYRF